MKFKIILLFSFCILTSHFCTAQINERIDSVVHEICESFNEYDKPKLDSVFIRETFSQHLSKYVSRMDDAAAQRTFDKIFTRLQLTCQKFYDYFSYYKNVNWVRVNECPRSTVSETEMTHFFQIHSFKYVEPNGDTTRLTLTDKAWVDSMPDGSHSTLSLKRISPSDFEIAFVESDNKIKMNMSRVGDKYFYSVISKEKNFYRLCVSVPNIKGSVLFNVYFE